MYGKINSPHHIEVRIDKEFIYLADNTAFHLGSTLDRVQRSLVEQIRRGLCFACDNLGADPRTDCDARAADVTRQFLGRLPAVRKLLTGDVQAAYEGDPAATCPDEAIFCYPGVSAITNYRLAHELHALGVPLIGERVRLYQGVTLGAKSFPLDKDGKPIKGTKRHPNVEDDVIIYSEATILGPVTIGRGSVIGGNVWLVHDVPPGSRITQAEARENLFERGGGI